MPEYCYLCPKCGGTQTIARSMRDKEVLPRCHCQGFGKPIQMIRDFVAENKNVGDKEYARPIHSDALALPPYQIAEHKKRFPDIKIDNEGRPIFDSYRKHNTYLEKIGMTKVRQRVKRRRGKKKITTAKTA